MDTKTVFIAFPGSIPEVASSVDTAVSKLQASNPDLNVHPWTANDIAGRCLVDPILEKITDSEFVVADITNLNFNVVYEVGFAIGRGKRVILVVNGTITSEDSLRSRVGIFDTLGYERYTDGASLAKIIQTVDDTKPLAIPANINKRVPVFVVLPREKAEAEVRLLSRLKKVARLHFRSYDPQENPRMSVRDAVSFVSESLATIIPLLPNRRTNHQTHNLRCAFVAGLSHSLGKETLILQEGDDPVPLDLRDFVSSFRFPNDIDGHIAKIAPRVTEKLQEVTQTEFPEIKNPLQDLYIGESAAENEFLDLGSYYVPVAAFDRVMTGAVQVVTGRKGSGKSALFFRLRDKTRKHRKNVVLDLNPEGFQLKKFRKLVVDQLESGTKEHTITAFWEYLLLLEVCYKLLEKDEQKHKFDHILREPYLELKSTFKNDKYIAEGDFAERLLRLTSGIEENFAELESKEGEFLTRDQITELIYCHDFSILKEKTFEYLAHKEQLWIFFDNLDKGWSAHGVGESDLLSVRCLIEAFRKLTRELSKRQIESRGVVFLRNDIFEHMIKDSSDRGKVARVSLDWNDESLLRELVRRRFVSTLENQDVDFESIWNSAVISHFADGTETSGYMIERSLMRPRCLLDFLLQCKGHALNLGHEKILEEDIMWAEEVYSTDLIQNVELEIQDVFPAATELLYHFIESTALLDSEQLKMRIGNSVKDEAVDEVINLLLWYGFVGVLRQTGEQTYIYDVNYDMKKFRALIANRDEHELVYVINPAFRRGLDISK